MNVHKFKKVKEYVESFITMEKLLGNINYTFTFTSSQIDLYKINSYISAIRILREKNVEFMIYQDKILESFMIDEKIISKVAADMGLFPIKENNSIYLKFRFDSIEESKLFFYSLLLEEMKSDK